MLLDLCLFTQRTMYPAEQQFLLLLITSASGIILVYVFRQILQPLYLLFNLIVYLCFKNLHVSTLLIDTQLSTRKIPTLSLSLPYWSILSIIPLQTCIWLIKWAASWRPISTLLFNRMQMKVVFEFESFGNWIVFFIRLRLLPRWADEMAIDCSSWLGEGRFRVMRGGIDELGG